MLENSKQKNPPNNSPMIGNIVKFYFQNYYF